MSRMRCYVLNIIVFSLGTSFPIGLSGEVQCTSPLARALYLTNQHYRKTGPEGEDNNKCCLVRYSAPRR